MVHLIAKRGKWLELTLRIETEYLDELVIVCESMRRVRNGEFVLTSAQETGQFESTIGLSIASAI